MAKKALITGISGQDGGYLAEWLLSKGYEVYGIVPTFQNARPEQLVGGVPKDGVFVLYSAEMSDTARLMNILEQVHPDEIYNLAAQSNPTKSFEEPVYTCDITGLGALRVLESVRVLGLESRVFHASSADILGPSPTGSRNENCPLHPTSPYGVAKVYAHWIMVNYREAYGVFACNGILFSHESPRRSEAFVSRKITLGLARIKAGQQDRILLGDLDGKRDWGFAGDYVEAMWLMLQQKTPDDYVIATGETHTVREFIEEAFGYAGVNPNPHVGIDDRLKRAAVPDYQPGDSGKARKVLNWKPKLDFRGLVRHMVDSDFRLLGLKPPR